MKKQIKDTRLIWEATRTCGMVMATLLYNVNVMFVSEPWEYMLLTQKYMKDIIAYAIMRNNSNIRNNNTPDENGTMKKLKRRHEKNEHF